MTAERQPQWAPTQRPGREHVRERLLEAAADEFTENGYAAATLQAIARRAGFTKGAVYSNFGSKQELFAQLLAKRSMELAERVLDTVAGLGPGETAERSGSAIASWVVAEPRWPLLVTEYGIQAGRDPKLTESYRRERRRLRSDVEAIVAERAHLWGVEKFDARRVATSLLALISGLAVEHSVDPEDIDETMIGQAVAELFAGAIARGQRHD